MCIIREIDFEMLELNLPFRETIGNLEFYDYDSVHCISLTGNEYKGFLTNVGNSCFVETVKNKTKYEFRYYMIKPTRLVLFEKRQKINLFFYEASTTSQEIEFIRSMNKQKNIKWK